MKTETILVLETTVDDLTPEVAGYVCERALELGALDAYATPVVMKKQRPGLVLTLLARKRQRTALVKLLLVETSTLGVRVAEMERVVLPRRRIWVKTRYGAVRVKLASAPGGLWKAAPEYEDCRAAARLHGAPLREVMAAAWKSASAGSDAKVGKKARGGGKRKRGA